MGNSDLITLGKSKLVPSVKELAKQSITIPPERYTRPDQATAVVLNPTSVGNVPVIDMQKLVSESSMKSELARLDSACREWGFFQLVNHGVDLELVEKVKHGIQKFFDLPLEEKKQFWQQETDIEGYGQAFVFSDEQKLDWADMFFMTTRPVDTRKPHLFPKLPQPFRDSIDTYSSETHNLAMTIFAFMEKALEMETNEITNLFEDCFQSMRMNYYPPCPQPEQLIGIAPHSDPYGITILIEVNEIEGLQIKKEGGWVPIKPLPNAFVVNVGDALQIITNGIYRSIEHRATINSVKERVSVATFCGPSFDAVIGPARSMVTQDTPTLYKTNVAKDYYRRFLSRELKGKSNLQTMEIENGMPDSA